MDTAAKIAVIRDIFIIVNSGIFTILLIGLAVVAFRSYRRLFPVLMRTSRNLEETSGLLLSLVSKPVNLLNSVVEMFNRVWGLVENLTNRERRKEDVENE